VDYSLLYTHRMNRTRNPPGDDTTSMTDQGCLAPHCAITSVNIYGNRCSDYYTGSRADVTGRAAFGQAPKLDAQPPAMAKVGSSMCGWTKRPFGHRA
jgi:hypothetical protein